MPIPLAYLLVIIVWSTTPLAIQWSSDAVGFSFGVMARMVVGVLMTFLIALLMRVAIPLHKLALMTYAISAANIFLGMGMAYWASSYIPSGWVSIMFGLNPLITGVFASALLNERVFTSPKMIGMTSAMAGLILIFRQGAMLDDQAGLGLLIMLGSVTFHALGGVLMKRFGEPLPALSITAMGLLLSLPLFFLMWYLLDGELVADIPSRTLFSIIYLGVFGSAVGFIAYFYLLKNIAASQVALIPLITPINALLLGYFLNEEPITEVIIIGTILVLSGLGLYQWKDGLGQFFGRFLKKILRS